SQVHALGGIQAQCVHIVDEHQQARQVHARRHAEFASRLHRVDEVAAGIGQTQNLGSGGLRLQHVGGEVGGAQRCPHVVDDASARRLDDVGGVALQGMAEGVVGGQEEPVLAAGIHNGGTRAASERRGVVGVMHGV